MSGCLKARAASLALALALVVCVQPGQADGHDAETHFNARHHNADRRRVARPKRFKRPRFSGQVSRTKQVTSPRWRRNWRSTYVRWSDHGEHVCGRYRQAAKYLPCAHVVRADDIFVEALLGSSRASARALLDELGLPNHQDVPPIVVINRNSSTARHLRDPRF